MKINIGCGDRYVAGWHNVDVAEMPHQKDQIVDLTDPLPWEPACADRIYAGHVLEHIPLPGCRMLLPRLLQVLKPGGTLMVVGPDCDKAWHMQQAGTLDVSLDSLRYGASRWSGDQHHWECTKAQLVILLIEAGFMIDIPTMDTIVADGWPVADPGPKWQAIVSGQRP